MSISLVLTVSSSSLPALSSRFPVLRVLAQAFMGAIMTLTAAGDEVILPTPLFVPLRHPRRGLYPLSAEAELSPPHLVRPCSPSYFNNDMLMTLLALKTVPLVTRAPSFLPTVEETRKLITSKTRAIVLVVRPFCRSLACWLSLIALL